MALPYSKGTLVFRNMTDPRPAVLGLESESMCKYQLWNDVFVFFLWFYSNILTVFHISARRISVCASSSTGLYSMVLQDKKNQAPAAAYLIVFTAVSFLCFGARSDKRCEQRYGEKITYALEQWHWSLIKQWKCSNHEWWLLMI